MNSGKMKMAIKHAFMVMLLAPLAAYAALIDIDGNPVTNETYLADIDMAEATFGDVQDNVVVAEYTYEDIKYTIDDYDQAMEQHLIAEREERGYTTREPDSYLASSHPRWKQDAEDWVAHRDAVMEYALQLINDIQSGLREPPTMEEFVDGLPKIHWTEA